MTRNILLLISAIAILTLSSASAGLALDKTMRVSPDGPYRTITEAINAASPGDTISVGAGTYRERLVIGKTVRLIGVGNPVIDGGGSGTVV
ncbi:MAG TPA: DUF1565 domain-containing protein, partial [Thermodesulfobacteriota bacterium]|nr:DUF1565 domain-containing protein [Thermodesulfobacteriota bacterium]